MNDNHIGLMIDRFFDTFPKRLKFDCFFQKNIKKEGRQVVIMRTVRLIMTYLPL